MAVTDTRPARPEQPGGGYILLNDTARRSSGFHCGTVMACQALRDGMAERGLAEAGWANDADRFGQILTRATRPRLVILNGEGTLHHNAKTGIEMLECCARAAAMGIPVAVINSVWQGNGARMGRLLASSASVVHMRETASRAALPEGVKATVTPDMSFLSFARFYQTRPAPARASAPDAPMAVIDNVRQPAAEALQDFAGRTGAPFFTMPRHMLNRLTQRHGETPGAALPALLTPPDLLTAEVWVTGRYHGLIAALAAGRRVCAIRSNTHKIEAMLHDACLTAALLPADWETLPAPDQDAALTRAIAAQDVDFAQRARAHVADAVTRINAMFDQIAALALRA